MNTPLKLDYEKRPDFQFERSDYREHYEDLAFSVLRSIARRKWLIALLVVLALALTCITIPMLPRKYSAEALIYPNLFPRDQGRREQSLASVDAAAIVGAEAHLIRSDAFLRAVATRLWQVPEATRSRSWARQSLESLDWLRATLLPETRSHSPFDRMVAMLRDKVAVTNDTRSYIISISFAAPSPDEAARVVNAFLIQYLRDKAIQRGLDIVNSATAQLTQQLAVYGDKHPKALQAAADLDAARDALEVVMTRQDSDQDGVTGDQSVKLAVPNQTPTSPRGFVILGLSLLSSLLAGICLAIWLDRREAKRKHPVGHQPQLQ
jgi:uncharacterized protein involved in exopolysaccharide biosynthesis